MKCAVGFCGHCQLGPAFICKDGPVFPYSQLEPWLAIRNFDGAKTQTRSLEICIVRWMPAQRPIVRRRIIEAGGADRDRIFSEASSAP